MMYTVLFVCVFFLHVEHKLKFSKYMRKKRKKIYCSRGLISSCLYPEVLWFSYLLPALSSLLSSFSLSPGLLLLCTQPGRPMPPAQPVKVQRGSAASGSEQLEHGAGWMDRDRDCGTATNTGGAPVGLHGDNISGAARWPTGRGYSNEQRATISIRANDLIRT